MIKINGEEKHFDSPTTVSDYIKDAGFKTERIVVELNRNILPKSEYDNTVLKDGDTVEIVSFVGGGWWESGLMVNIWIQM